jgi:Tfp pilus assembly protein PilF
MKKFIISFICMSFVLFSVPAMAQQMTWTTKSKEAKSLALAGASHMMNAEFAQAYTDFSSAVKLDPNFMVALVYMANLSYGQTRKDYAARALESTKDKTEGEKLFASTLDPTLKADGRRPIWEKLHKMFPDGKVLANLYVQTRTTPEERFAAAEDYIKKFPDEASMYNTIAYYYMQDKKDNAMAKQNFEKYISLYPDGCNPYDSMGEFYLNTGDTTNAEKYYKMALEKYPFNSSSVDALQKINDAKKK